MRLSNFLKLTILEAESPNNIVPALTMVTLTSRGMAPQWQGHMQKERPCDQMRIQRKQEVRFPSPLKRTQGSHKNKLNPFQEQVYALVLTDSITSISTHWGPRFQHMNLVGQTTSK
jgi:hypothetical protein